MAKYKLTLELSDGNTIDASGYIEIPDKNNHFSKSISVSELFNDIITMTCIATLNSDNLTFETDVQDTGSKSTTKYGSKSIDFQGSEIQLRHLALLNKVAPFVNTISPIIEQDFTSYGETLNIEPNTLYIVQCFSTDGNIKSLRIEGNGNRNGEDGKMALVITGSSIDENLCILQTGSAVITNLVVTDSRVTGIKPSNNDCRLRYFKVGGYAIKTYEKS